VTDKKCIFQETQCHFLERAFDRLKLKDAQRENCCFPCSAFRETRVTVPVTLRYNGGNTLRTFQGYRVQHNHACGPFKGQVVLSLGCQYGRGPGVGTVDDLEELSKRFCQKMAPIIGVHDDIPAPDIGTNPQVMAWMLDEHSKTHGFQNDHCHW